jgi:hypothetical protein
MLYLIYMTSRKRKREKVDRNEFHTLLVGYGFSGPRHHFVSRDIMDTYQRGADVVEVVYDGAPTPILKFELRGQKIVTWHLSLAAAEAVIRAHPETMQGKFDELQAADAAAKPSGA